MCSTFGEGLSGFRWIVSIGNLNYIFNMQLTQINEPSKMQTIAEMFREMAKREAEEIRQARERALKKKRK